MFATPSHHLRSIARSGCATVAPDATIVVATKGIERDTLALMTTVIECEVPDRPVVGLSGPSFAAEVVARQPTAIVAASREGDAATRVQGAFSNTAFRVYTHDDVAGVVGHGQRAQERLGSGHRHR